MYLLGGPSKRGLKFGVYMHMGEFPLLRKLPSKLKVEGPKVEPARA